MKFFPQAVKSDQLTQITLIGSSQQTIMGYRISWGDTWSCRGNQRSFDYARARDQALCRPEGIPARSITRRNRRAPTRHIASITYPNLRAARSGQQPPHHLIRVPRHLRGTITTQRVLRPGFLFPNPICWIKSFRCQPLTTEAELRATLEFS